MVILSREDSLVGSYCISTIIEFIFAFILLHPTKNFPVDMDDIWPFKLLEILSLVFFEASVGFIWDRKRTRLALVQEGSQLKTPFGYLKINEVLGLSRNHYIMDI
jgi:hypothetical protein